MLRMAAFLVLLRSKLRSSIALEASCNNLLIPALTLHAKKKKTIMMAQSSAF